jgi:hypothetical protein
MGVVVERRRGVGGRFTFVVSIGVVAIVIPPP